MPRFRGASALADYVHRALHSDKQAPDKVRKAIAGHRLALVERAHRIANGRRAMSTLAPARERWTVTAQFLFDEHAFNMEAYTSEPVKRRETYMGRMPAPRRGGYRRHKED